MPYHFHVPAKVKYIDVGASYGITALVATVAVGRHGVVYAFEPQSDAFQRLVHIKGRFGWDNVHPIQSLVGDRTGECVLYEYENNSRLSSISPTWKKKGRKRPVTYPTTTLDDWTSNNNVLAADMVKIDVEGAELQVIQGAKRFLARAKPILLVEINNRPRRKKYLGYEVDDLLAELRTLGYDDFYALRPTGLAPFYQEEDLLDSDLDMLVKVSQ